MNIDQRTNIKFCFKLGKAFTKTHHMRKHDDDCLSRSRIYEWFKRFKEGREDLQDERPGRRKDVVNKKKRGNCA